MDTKHSKSRRRFKKTSMVKPTPNVSTHLDELLPQLKSYVWKYEAEWNEKKGERQWRKPARSPGFRGSRKIRWSEENFETDKRLWGTFDEAFRTYEKNSRDLQGVGFLVEPDRCITINGKQVYVVWIDLDSCRNVETEEIEPWAVEILQTLDTYAEISPSGTGIRIVSYIVEPRDVRCRICTPDGKKFSYLRDIPESSRDGYHRVEVYGANKGGRHLITFTGVPLEGYDKPGRNIQEWIDSLIPLKEYEADDANIEPEPLDLSDEEIVQVMLASKDGRLIERFMAGDESLWKGKDAKYGSRSEADQGFFRKLAFYVRGDEERIKRIALYSKMRREKWNREGYLDDSITRGVKYCQGNFYDPNYSSKDILIEQFFEVWMGLKHYKIRRALGALLARTNAYGQYTRPGYIVKAHDDNEYPFPEEGLWVYASLRDLAIWMGEGDVANVSRAMKVLRKEEEEGLVYRISEGRGSKASLYLLPTSILPPPHSDTQDSYKQHRRETQEKLGPNCSCVSLLCCKSDSKTYLELVWVRKPKNRNRGLTNDQKLLVELVLFGEMRNIKELVEFFSKREDNLRSKVIKPVVEMSLLEWYSDEEDYLKIPEGFEETLHEIFVESGGQEAPVNTEEKFRKDREDYKGRGEEANEDAQELEEEEQYAAISKEEGDHTDQLSGWKLFMACERSSPRRRFSYR